MAIADDLRNAANMIRKAMSDSQTRLQNLHNMAEAVKVEADQIRQLANTTSSEIKNFETMARQLEQQAKVADDMQRLAS